MVSGTSTMNLWISALEPSADRWSASLARALRRLSPEVRLSGVTSGGMCREGFPVLQAPKAAMGFLDPVARIPQYVRFLNEAVRCCHAEEPDVVLVLDSPDFHFPFLRRLRTRAPVVYLCPPQVWAWRGKRAREAGRLCTHIVTLFEWEREWFLPYLPAEQVVWFGHPLADEGLELAVRHNERDRLLLLPGSRESEIRRLSPLFAKVAAMLGIPALFGAVDDRAARWVRDALRESRAANCDVIAAPLRQIWGRARACLACAGTVTLEAACAGIPTVVAYRTDVLTYWVARLLLRTRRIALPNILLGKEAYRECVQADAVPGTLAQAVAEALAEPEEIWRERATQLVSQLGPPGVFDRTAAFVMTAATRHEKSGDPS